MRDAKRLSDALDTAHQALQRANTLFRLIEVAIVDGKLDVVDAGSLAEIGREATAAAVDRLDVDVEYFAGVNHG